MINFIVKSKKRNVALSVLFVIGVILSVIGYMLRGTVNSPASHTSEGIGALIGGLSGILLFVWFCLMIMGILRKK